MPWYYEVDRQARGPVSDDEFDGLVKTGLVRAETLIWKEGWPDWRAYGAVTGNAPLSSAPSSPPPPAYVPPQMGGGASASEMAVCAVSGRTLPKRDMLEFEGRWVSVEHKAEFFQRLREGVNLPSEMVYASFGRRFGAKIVDSLLLGVANAIVGAICGFVIAILMKDSGSPSMVAIIIKVVAQLAGIVISLAYCLYFTLKDNATPGKKMLGLQLVRADGTSLSKGRIVGRYFAEFINMFTLGIGYLMAAFDKEERRALHDRICDTRVIDVRGR